MYIKKYKMCIVISMVEKSFFFFEVFLLEILKIDFMMDFVLFLFFFIWWVFKIKG